MNLRPNCTIIQVIDQAIYFCVRTYTIDEKEVQEKLKIRSIPYRQMDAKVQNKDMIHKAQFIRYMKRHLVEKP